MDPSRALSAHSSAGTPSGSAAPASRSDTNSPDTKSQVSSVRFSQSVSQWFFFTVPPRAHPSTGSQSGSAAPGLTQVPSTRSRGPLNCRKSVRYPATSGSRIFLGYSCSALSRERTHRIGQEILVIQRSFIVPRIVAWHLAAPLPHEVLEDAPRYPDRKGLHLVTGPYLYTRAPEVWAYLPKRWACTTGW